MLLGCIFSFVISSCGKEETPTITSAVDTPATVRSSNNCSIEGVCDSTVQRTYTFYNNAFDCDVTVTMDVTRCDVNGKVVYYFEDEDKDFQFSAGCPNTVWTDLLAQEAIDYFIKTYFVTEQIQIPPCGSQGVMTSRQIKVDCTRLCQVPTPRIGIIAYGYKKCAVDPGCCVQELNWCLQNGLLRSYNEINTPSPFQCQSITPNCNSSNSLPDQITYYEPCGIRCDL